MITGKVLYTDGHKVMVTDSTFQVKRHFYRLDGIIRHSLTVIPPNRVPVIVLISIGIVFLSLGIFNAVPTGMIQTLELGTYSLSTRALSFFFGVALLVSGVALLVIVKERYGVEIITAEGKKEVVVSKQKEYVDMIVEALNKALGKW
jgi:Family of unknown function (DUF6232)